MKEIYRNSKITISLTDDDIYALFIDPEAVPELIIDIQPEAMDTLVRNLFEEGETEHDQRREEGIQP